MESIRQLQINNYKSIRQVNLDCTRVNVLVGEPNVGKSNILEALDLSYLSWFFNSNELMEKSGFSKINLKEYFRVDKVSDLFRFGDISNPISVIHPGFSFDTFIKYNNKDDRNIFEWTKSTGSITEFSNDFEPIDGTQYFSSPIKPYRYRDNVETHDVGNYLNTLMPPFGNNLETDVIKRNSSFLVFVEELIKDLGFELNFDTSSGKILIQLRVSKGLVYSMPYEAMADTLKRVIFYTAAIRYNNAHVITLEEPEVHSFPKYISFLADEIIKMSDRQFFIATHSPYLLNNLIENTPAHELSIFVCGYDKNKFETIVKKLTEEELSELLNYGVDIFFNINRYLDDRIEHNS
jgi:AAA15 family ATPase/GTPase